MTLSRLVRIQLVLFTTASIVGVAVMFFGYMQVPMLLGLGHITVTIELPSSGGLYRFSNVTYRGVQVGKVTNVKVVDRSRVQAVMALDPTPKIPAQLTAHVRSVSAVGEQFVDLQPVDDNPPYLHDGSVIPLRDTTIPQPVGPMLDQLTRFVDSIPQDKLSTFLDESYRAFNGAGSDFGSLLDSAATLADRFDSVSDRARIFTEDAGPLLDGQALSTEATRTWARSLAGITSRLQRDDRQVLTLLSVGPPAVQAASRLFEQIKPTLPILLANLNTVGQVLVTYQPALEQLLVLMPPSVAEFQSIGALNNPTGLPLGDFTLAIADPPPCTVGFLPPSSWRSPADTTTIDTPDGLYCKLPQDSPIAVRGARNYPCMGRPEKRAPTVEICDSEEQFEPLAMRQHALGPAPLDPNLIAQGIPPDDRVDVQEHIFGPLDGTPRPDSPVPGEPSPSPRPPLQPEGEVAPQSSTYDTEQAPTASATAPPEQSHVVANVPNSFVEQASTPLITVAHYDPKTGSYMASDGHYYRQFNLSAQSAATQWTDLLMPRPLR